MGRRTIAVGCVVSVVAACGGSATSHDSGGAGQSSTGSAGKAGDGAAGGFTTGGTGHAGSSNAGAGTTSHAGSANGGSGSGQAGDPSTEGGAWHEGGWAGQGNEAGFPDCGVIACPTDCPGERWSQLDGCLSCACAPPAALLQRQTWDCPSASLSVTASSSWFIGGYNRWLIDFEWKCTVQDLGQPGRATLEIGLIQPQPTPIDETNRTFYLPIPQTLKDYEVREATVFLRGSGVPEIKEMLQPLSSFLSIRREGNELVGGVEYEGQDSTHAYASKLAASFRVPVPTP